MLGPYSALGPIRPYVFRRLVIWRSVFQPSVTRRPVFRRYVGESNIVVVLQSFFTTLERNCWRRNNNLAVARTRTVEVLKQLIGDATEGADRTTGNGGRDVLRA